MIARLICDRIEENIIVCFIEKDTSVIENDSEDSKGLPKQKPFHILCSSVPFEVREGDVLVCDIDGENIKVIEKDEKERAERHKRVTKLFDKLKKRSITK